MDVLRNAGLQAASGDGTPLPVVLVHPASQEQGEAFFTKRWPGARAIADPGKDLFRAFGLKRGSFWQLFGPKVVWAGIKGMFAGFGAGRPEGDPWLLSGQFLVQGENILWEQRHVRAGDPLDLDGLRKALDAQR